MTTENYLNQLEEDRQDLVDNLETQGITGLTGDETFTELVPQVLNISGGGEEIDWSQIGYSDTPDDVQEIYNKIDDDFNYSKNIYDNWVQVQDLTQKFYNNTDLVYMPAVNTSIATKMTSMFQGCTNLKTVPSLNTSSVSRMDYMFSGCTKLYEIPSLDISNVLNTDYMFQSCANLTTITLLNMNKVVSFNNMFNGCTNLTTINGLPNVELTGRNLSFNNMFSGCTNLTTISSLNINMTDNSANASFYGMFNNCKSLVTLDLSGIICNSVSNVGSMFYNCINLTTLDIRNIDFTGVSQISTMFGYNASSGPPNNCLIIVKDQANKTWLTTNFSRLTNVQTVEEYEANS